MVLYAVCKNCCFSKELEANLADSGNEECHHQQQISSEKPGQGQKVDHQGNSNEDHNKLVTLDHAV